MARPMTKLAPKRNIWAVRDEEGLVHMAQVLRFYDDVDDMVSSFHVSTACHPNVTQVRSTGKEGWVGQHLPRTAVYYMSPMNARQSVEFIIIAWNVREAPTCFACALHPVLT
jgi:hypothetical protein